MKKLSLIMALMLIFTLAFAACTKTETTTPATDAPDTESNTPAAADGEFVYVSELDSAKEAQIKETITGFMSCYEEDRVSDALAYLSSSFETNADELGEFFKSLHELAENPFLPYDAYYLDNLEVSDIPIHVKKNKDSSEYLEIVPANEETYIAFYLSEGEHISRLLTIVLTNDNGEFKISFLNPTDFKYAGEDAPALYEKTKKLSDEGKLIAAYINSVKVINTYRPGGYLRYAIDTECEDLYYKLYMEIAEKHELPLAIEGTNSSVYVIGITNDEDHGVIPMVLFKTDVDITNEEALSAESGIILSKLEELSPGFIESFEYVSFEATNESPEENIESMKTEKVVIALGK